MNCWPFQWLILNSSNYVLPYVNDGNTSFILEKVCTSKWMKSTQGLVIAWESNYSLSAWVLEGSVQSQTPAFRPLWIDIMSTAQKVFLEWHSGQHVEHIQCCIDYFEWLSNRIHQTFFSPSTLFSICHYPLNSSEDEMESVKTTLPVLLMFGVHDKHIMFVL